MARNPIVENADLETDSSTDDLSLDTSTTEAVVTETPAEPQTTVSEPELPAKLRGKSITDVAAMYQNLERELGRQANEIGVYRDLVGSLSEIKRNKDLAEVTTKDTTPEVTSDDLFEDPQTAIQRVVKGALEKELTPLREEQRRTAHQKELDKLVADYPTLEQVGADPAFLEFVQRSPYRVNDAQKWLTTQDVEAARRLLSDWSEIASVSKPSKATAEPVTEKAPRGNVQAARRAATESGGNASVGQKTLTKSAVMKLLQTDPDRYYSDAFQSELHTAIKEGRFKA